MSAHHQLFIKSDKPEPEIIGDLSLATGTDIAPIQAASDAPSYGGKFKNCVAEVQMHHDFDDDLGMNFSQYPILVTIRNLSSDKSAEESIARDVFEKLKNVDGYKVMLAFDLQKLLAQS